MGFLEMLPLMGKGLWETLYMTVGSTALAYLIGLPLGLLLAATAVTEEEVEDVGRRLHGPGLAPLDGRDMHHRVQRNLGSSGQVNGLQRSRIERGHTGTFHRIKCVIKRSHRLLGSVPF